ncbi:MAG: hypothetical protein LBD50_02125 [Rickettsiales bacterium]|nr:hypothetical protein [Rickettsiales bacterium]
MTAACCALFAGFCCGSFAATNADIGNFGTWMTEQNQTLFVNGLTEDIKSFQSEFQQNVLVKDYVPIEARVGRAFIGALSYVGQVLEKSLVRFISVFIIVMLAFWIMMESYQMIRGKKKVREQLEAIVKKLVLATVWILVIEQGPAQLFMWIMGPILSIGTELSDLILNSVSAASGAILPDTCAAIHKYTAVAHTNDAFVNSAQTADLLCLTTRLSGFFSTAVAAGWKWMLAGIGTSALTFVAGAVFVVIFIYNMWKFALTALGVIADLFLVIIMLPFTAIAQVFGGQDNQSDGMFGAPIDAFGGGGGKTSYDGYAGKIFNQFFELFKTQSLSAQIQKFIQSAIYFVSLSIVIALCAAILSGVVDSNLAAQVPTLKNDGFMITLIVGCLVAYLATKAGEIAKKLGGSIDESFGKQVGGDIKKIWGKTTGTAKNWWKIIRKK